MAGNREDDKVSITQTPDKKFITFHNASAEEVKKTLAAHSEDLDGITLDHTEFYAADLLRFTSNPFFTATVTHCEILCNNQEYAKLLHQGVALNTSKTIFPPPPPPIAPVVHTTATATSGFQIRTKPKVEKPEPATLKDRLHAAPDLRVVKERMKKVQENYNKLPHVFKDNTLACRVVESTKKDAFVLQQGTEPLLTAKPGGTEVHPAFLASPISDEQKAELILTSLGLPPAPGSTEDLPEKLSITPLEPMDPVKAAVITKYADIKKEFDAKKGGPAPVNAEASSFEVRRSGIK